MLQSFDSGFVRDVYMISIPFAILMLENEKEQAFMAELYTNHKRLIFITAVGFFPNNRAAANDIVSDVIIALCKRCKNLMLKDCNELTGYVVNTTKNICRTKLRRDKSERENRDYYADEYIEKIAGKSDLHSDIFTINSGVVSEALEKLNERYQMLINMKHVEGLSYREMSERLGDREETLRTSIFRARNRLKQLMQEGNREDL